MLRIPIKERPRWRERAAEFGFNFHTMYGEPYWDETAYYQFSLQQIERDIEDPTAELHSMCLAVVDKVSKDSFWLERFQIPELYWDAIAQSWQQQQPSLYSRLDLVYDGHSAAKLLENNADTPTSLYESGFWQWLWLQDNVDKGLLPRGSDQFNSLQEKLIKQLGVIADYYQTPDMHFSCCKDTEEDRGTVQYLQDCASDAGVRNHFVFIEDIGIAEDTNGETIFSDLDDTAISTCFKLYPWEFMLREDFGPEILNAKTQWIEPIWKSILSNKALLPLLWEMFPNHPNLLPAFFADKWNKPGSIETSFGKWVKKPLYSREGANISILDGSKPVYATEGPYGDEGYIIQAHTPLPRYGDNHTLIGSWLVNDEPAGISVREDISPITQDLSRYLPHVING
ncbi:glutathionylspermidine synthase family protein [Alteromonas facilis]|uniref:glutathionylspermidine synthase family protein n=1 Tax=Alteromonas facilis TaxID=2048004 RepID=UPI000C28CE87|nr:glutathionylspermidine synthase family protein [Alteromonas facilis]